MVLRRLRSLWRQLLRSERPKQQPALWRSRDIAAVLLLMRLLRDVEGTCCPCKCALLPCTFSAATPRRSSRLNAAFA